MTRTKKRHVAPRKKRWAKKRWAKKRWALPPLGLYYKILILLALITGGLAYAVFSSPRNNGNGNGNGQPQKIFKMWYSYGWANPNVGYAESVDGKVWIKYLGNPIVSDGTCSSVFKDEHELTYYLFYSVPAGSMLHIKRLHSFNGINFIDNGIVLSPSGDERCVANSFVWKEGPNDWRMLYDALSITLNLWRVGYATSSDGLNWFKSASNPVVSTYGGGTGHVQKIGSTYWLWTWGTDNGCGLPTDGYRQKSTNLITWTAVPAHACFPRMTADEGVGTSVGQVADQTLIEFNNQVYMYYTASTDGRESTGNMHLKLAIANMNFPQLIETNENFGGNVFVRYGNVLIADMPSEQQSLHEPTVLYDTDPQIIKVESNDLVTFQCIPAYNILFTITIILVTSKKTETFHFSLEQIWLRKASAT